jgi:hypothetical protein
MKQLSLVTAVAIALLFTSTVKAQTTDYFAGKWKVTVYGTPNGDAAMFFNLVRKDGKLAGTFSDSTEKEKTKLTQIDEKDSVVTLYFTTQGYDVNVLLQKVPADSVKGNLMGMFDCKGVRVKEK